MVPYISAMSNISQCDLFALHPLLAPFTSTVQPRLSEPALIGISSSLYSMHGHSHKLQCITGVLPGNLVE